MRLMYSIFLGLLVGFPAWPQTPSPAAPPQPTYSYSPTNKRDPFKPPLRFEEEDLSNLPEVQRYTLEQLKLTSILWNEPDSNLISRAMFKDPKSKIYILKEGDRIGKNFGVIFKISKEEVIVAEKYADPFGNESIQETTLVISKAKDKQ